METETETEALAFAKGAVGGLGEVLGRAAALAMP